MEVIDDFIIPQFQSLFENMLLSKHIPLYLSDSTINKQEYEQVKSQLPTNIIDSPQLNHVFYYDGKVNSDYWDSIQMLNQQIGTIFEEEQKLFRIKMNVTFPKTGSTVDSFYVPHTDHPSPHTVAIYYVNDSDGDTAFFDDDYNIIKRVSPKRGRLVLFDGATEHAGQPPITSDLRCVINFVFLKDI
jgi:hypothetical protein